MAEWSQSPRTELHVFHATVTQYSEDGAVTVGGAARLTPNLAISSQINKFGNANLSVNQISSAPGISSMHKQALMHGLLLDLTLRRSYD